MAVNLVVPLKRLTAAKSRLAERAGSGELRSALALAMAMDTVAAALATPAVRRVLVAAADPTELGALRELGAEVVFDGGESGLNAGLRHVARQVRAEDPDCVVGALQADLPALRPDDLAAAIAASGARRAFCADRAGTGTTLLLSAPAGELDPHFGPGSARAHTESGAAPVELTVPTLRADVDTPDDLAHVQLLGVGEHTRAALQTRTRAC
nr:2-phospho-L-lactate guanylyltransferase [Thermocrispum agreste]